MQHQEVMDEEEVVAGHMLSKPIYTCKAKKNTDTVNFHLTFKPKLIPTSPCSSLNS